MTLPIEVGQADQRWIVVGEELGEMAQAASDAQHGRSGASARGAFQVGDQRISQSGWNTGEVTPPRPTQMRGVFRSWGDLPTQVIQNSAGGIQRGPVVLEWPLMCLFAGGDRGAELGDIGIVKLGKRVAGLDQHAHRDLAGQPRRYPGCVAQFGCCGKESGHITSQGACVCLP
ncbi:hypothetical protein [Mycobacterium heckeshornense]|uniref:Uncharacterized protein n=1 Tax=Mycobacterium heckeshornense TaxID=110505 RepID=A0A7R7GUJ1_9MYCO|nr:hypothetical protein [Mycobacterium heckeshornense]BCO34912.1 hypothetical protein MHEC_13450 [Mycobacterium heckeshornense]BCO36222.1 hypothetical protein MHEC_26550 [Mycobacterium heckeshornense]